MRKIVIDSNKLVLKMCAVEEGELVDFRLENKSKSSIAGNIYKGKIINVLNDKKCAFIDLGDKNIGFLNFKDVKGNSKVVVGRDLIVQVVSDSVGEKMPKVTTEISFKGFYIVLLLNSGVISFSKKIVSNEKKKFLKEKIGGILPENCGVIVRTEAENENIDLILEELERLINIKNQIETFYVLGKSPKSIKKSESTIYNFLNLHTREDYEIFTNDSLLMDDLINRYPIKKIHLFNENNIFDHFKILNTINDIFSRTVGLKGGGFLVFDNTEAFTVIDVNSGKENEALNKSISYSVNIQAIDEIVKQIKYRSISGIILIDLIDIDRFDENEKLLSYADKKFKEINGYVLGLTKLGILEVTRKREHRNTIEEYYDKCKICDGFGYEKNYIEDGTNFINELRRMSYHYNSETFKFIVKKEFYQYIMENSILTKDMIFYENSKITVELKISNDIDGNYKISY